MADFFSTYTSQQIENALGYIIGGSLTTALNGKANTSGTYSGITAGAATTATHLANYAHTIGNTNNYPFHRIMHTEAITGSYVDRHGIFLISQGYDNGCYGIFRVTLRTNNVATTNGRTPDASSARIEWLLRKGFAEDAIQAGFRNTGGNTYIDVYYKSNGAYASVVVTRLQTSQRSGVIEAFTYLRSTEVNDTTASDKKTSSEVYKQLSTSVTNVSGRTYTTILKAVDGASVNYAKSAGSVAWSGVSGKTNASTTAAGLMTAAQVNDLNNVKNNSLGIYTNRADDYCHCEGYGTAADCPGAHAEGYSYDKNTIGSYSEGAHAEGYASQNSSVQSYGYGSHAEGCSEDEGSINASNNGSHAEGYTYGCCIDASGEGAHAEGYASYGDILASGDGSHAEGCNTTAESIGSHAEGYGTVGRGNYSHAEGSYCYALGHTSHASGMAVNAANYAMTAIGRYNKAPTTTYPTTLAHTGDLFVIGNGTSSARSNAFRVTAGGAVYAKAAYNSSGADYAEYFEWEDGNMQGEDRIGHFVSLTENGKIKVASHGENVIGVVSGISSIIGNAAEDSWDKMYLRDVYGRTIEREIEYEERTNRKVQDTNEDGSLKFRYGKKKVVDEETGEEVLVEDTENPIPVWKRDADGKFVFETEKKTCIGLVLNPEYDSNQEYIPRSQRKEWDVVGLMGQVIVDDDGTCIVGKRCSVAEGGIATLGTDYIVIKRIDSNHIVVLASFI